jgi:hypothetical protein
VLWTSLDFGPCARRSVTLEARGSDDGPCDPGNRIHFVYRIDIWADDGKNILEHLAGMENLIVVRAAYRAACERWPKARITLCQSARVVEDSRRT